LRKKKEPTRLLNFKANKEIEKKLWKLAKTHCDGNLSKWIRVAALNYRPTQVKEARVA